MGWTPDELDLATERHALTRPRAGAVDALAWLGIWAALLLLAA